MTKFKTVFFIFHKHKVPLHTVNIDHDTIITIAGIHSQIAYSRKK
ncbi:MAG: hypothetical protein RIR11_396 [Bacteroidota bacterium]|jgi:hypothetical protein